MYSKESLKSLVLFLLLGSSLFLSAQIFFTIDGKSQSIENTNIIWQRKDNNIKEFFNPQSYFINFGGSLHSVEYNNERQQLLLSNMRDVFYSLESDAMVVDSSLDRWETFINKRGLRLKMFYPMAFDDFLTLLSGQEKDFETMIVVDEINVVLTGEVLIKSTEGYYEFKLTQTDLMALSQSINLVEEDYLEYRRLEDIYSLQGIIESNESLTYLYNNALVPIVKISDIPIIEVISEVNIENEETNNIKNYANRILGQSFIRKVYDQNGSIIYMTGYGEKALKIDYNGYFEYTEKMNENIDDMGFKEGLNRSLNALMTLGDLPSNIYLSDHYSYIKNEKLIERYEFNYAYSGYDVILEKDSPAAFVVEFNGNQLIYLKRQYKKFVNSIGVSKIWDSALTFSQIINNNYDVIVTDYLGNQAAEEFGPLDEYIYEILQNIEHLELKYYLVTKDGYDSLVPVWQLVIADYIYYINIYDGEILSKNKK